MSESNILTSADKEFNAPPTVVRSALSLNPPSLLALSGVNPTNEALPAVCISFTAPVIVFEFVFKVVCGRAPMSESNSLIAPTKSESTVVVNLARPPTSLPIVFVLLTNCVKLSVVKVFVKLLSVIFLY